MASAIHKVLPLLAITAVASLLDASSAAAVCSVFDKHPCVPTVCSVFRHRPCLPDIFYPFGEDLRLTIYSAPDDKTPAMSSVNEPDDPNNLDTIRAMFRALRTCWIPPEQDEALADMQMTVRFALKRNGEMIAAPWVTYATHGVSLETRDIYFKAIMAALRRCMPLPLTEGLAGAIAGRPVAIRYVDNRKLQQQSDDQR
jgi:hypothetical protein